MLASLCVETINTLFRQSRRICWWFDEHLFKTWEQIYRYFKSADSFTIGRIVESYRHQYRGEIPVIMMPLQIRMGILELNLGKKTVQTISFLQSIEKKDVRIVEVHCSNNLDCASIFSNLKALQLGDCNSDDKLRCVSRECPLLEKVKCCGRFTDIGLDYLGDLSKLKDLSVSGQRLTAAGMVSYLKKSRAVLELFACISTRNLCDAVDLLASQNEVLPNIEYFECNKLSKLATAFKVFPCIRSLIVYIRHESSKDFNKLQNSIKNNETAKHLNILAVRYHGRSVSYDILRSLNIIFPQITSLTFSFNIFFGYQSFDGESISYLDATVDSSSSEEESGETLLTPFFQSVINLDIGYDITTGMLRTCMHPASNIKYLRVRDARMFELAEFRLYLRHLTELEEIHLSCCYLFNIVDYEFIDRFVKLLPSLRVFRIDFPNYPFIDPKVLRLMRFVCSSINSYELQVFVNGYTL